MRASIVGEAVAKAGILLVGVAVLVLMGAPVWAALAIFGVAGIVVGLLQL